MGTYRSWLLPFSLFHSLEISPSLEKRQTSILTVHITCNKYANLLIFFLRYMWNFSLIHGQIDFNMGILSCSFLTDIEKFNILIWEWQITLKQILSSDIKFNMWCKKFFFMYFQKFLVICPMIWKMKVKFLILNKIFKNMTWN